MWYGLSGRNQNTTQDVKGLGARVVESAAWLNMRDTAEQPRANVPSYYPRVISLVCIINHNGFINSLLAFKNTAMSAFQMRFHCD